MRFLAAILCSMLLWQPANAAEDVMPHLNEIADALIQKGANGAYGAHYYRSLPTGADGRKIIRIYMQPYEREMALINNNLWYQLAEPKPLSPTMEQWVLEEYRRELPQIHFEKTDDPTQATMFMLEARFMPNTRSGKQRSPDSYIKTAANSMNAKIGNNLAALIHFNTGGNPWFKQAIDNGEAATVRATILNEFFNGLAVTDFQDLDVTKLSPSAQAWFAQHRAEMDHYTITRSGGPRDDEYLKPLDKVILQKLFQ